MKINLITFLFLFGPVFGYAQNKKSVDAIKLSKPLAIDGYLNEPEYQVASPAKDFFQLQPNNGEPSFQPSEVYFFYDQNAIYVGAMLYDNSTDSIFNYLSKRDDIGMSDYFGVYFDPYNEGQLAYGFFITPAGVQTDMKAIKSGNDQEDGNWDAVWQSKTRITDRGWVIEMRIPYSNLRFPEKDIHTWGMNMFRNIRRYNSNNSWNFIDRKVSGFIHQQGTLNGIKDIKPPVRLSFTPYAATYFETSKNGSTDVLYKGGMDVKYGINESFTLDMMLIPDFGQIQSDDKQLNLSPYELYYNEKRQFFNEGTELFQRGDIFYSRRIGGTPKFSDEAEDQLKENEIIDYNPSSTRLANATKISGRNDKGLGVGFLNAMSLPAKAEILDTITKVKRKIEVQPFTNYNTFVVDKTLNNNSYISVINTNITMENNPFRANVTASEFLIRDKNKKFSIGGKGGISYRKTNYQNKENGGYAQLELKKDKGSLTYGIEQSFRSKNFNPNDMGYLQKNNILKSNIWTEYALIDPFWIMREMYIGFNGEYERIVDPSDKLGTEVETWAFIRFKNNSSFSSTIGIKSKQNDYDETRVDNRFYLKPYHLYYNYYYSSDTRKNINYNIYFGGFNYPLNNNSGEWIGFTTNARLGQHIRLQYNFRIDNEYNDKGYVNKSDDDSNIQFGNRDVEVVENTIEMDYTFNNKLSLAFRSRHYWSGVKYNAFYTLQNNGNLSSDNTYNENQDTNYNIFNIDTILRWYFAPGSELSLSWKNEIFNDQDYAIYGINNNIKDTFEATSTNTLSLKILYYLDFNTIKHAFTNK
ncbi:DUF5916 domain-containing protein [Plebeiibacterium sediminum]|uniref:Carbohydrate binding family 9 domain-containing protein n=1 Tax=Plebeiibacterium sediminum TaxID=2992112 RepID=A0AAE3M7T7_9BACT|nr:DUF5916 domain-containing protein [Plebeiobacterium sediminum]MCW3788409.1 carbohydrate binding family 9 domain-containing protein [Plebeiobacterium sediminum]